MRKSTSCFKFGLVLLLTTACSGSQGPNASDDAIAAGRAACDRYLECVAATTPEAVGTLLEGYGPEGTCWQTDEIPAIDLCAEACAAGRANAAKLFPGTGACGECSNDDDCASAKTGPRCETKTSSCVACLEAADCTEGVCEPTRNTCVECAGDKDCGTDEACTANKCGPRPICLPEQLHCTYDAGAAIEICNDAGIGWDVKTDCSAQGLSCEGTKCSYTPYGPCLASGDCADDSDTCIPVGNDHGYCIDTFDSCAGNSDCAVPLPNSGKYDVVCTAPVCAINCENNSPCPLGMACVAGTCAWLRPN